MRVQQVQFRRGMLLLGVTLLGLSPILLLASSNQSCITPAAGAPVAGIPAQEDWIDYGAVLASGQSGEWDDGLGMAPPMSAVVQRDGVIYLYYVGFDGVRALDGGERHRSIGVATSADGIHFTKHENNPLIIYRPNNNEEEAAGGVAASVADDGTVMLYWGASDAGSPTSLSVDSDIRLSTSSDGFSFTDHGDIISHINPTVWGYGDELFPLGAYEHEGRWQLYYIAKGLFGIDWDVGLASGDSATSLPDTRCALSKGQGTNFFGGGSIAEIAPKTYAIFLARNNGDPYVEVRAFAPETPHLLSEPVAMYDFPGLRAATLLLDKERRTYFMYALDSSAAKNYFEWHIHLKLAPFGERDGTPPGAPPGLAASVGEPGGVLLNWQAAEDIDTGIINYNIYRDGVKIGTTFGLQYHDDSEGASDDADYEVAAVNLHGVEGPRSGPVRVSQPPPLPPLGMVFMPLVRR